MNRKTQCWEGAGVVNGWREADHPQGRLSGLCKQILAILPKLPSIAAAASQRLGTAWAWEQHSMTSSQEGLVVALNPLLCPVKTWSHPLAHETKPGLEAKRNTC